MTEGNTEIFPQIKEVVHPRLVVPGMEFMYVRTKNLKRFHDEGWVQVARSDPFERNGEDYTTMRRGTPIRGGAEIIPRVMIDIDPPKDAA
jgi:hypothetical protein